MYFFLHQYMQDRVLSMSQLKTAWPNAFFGRFTQHLFAQSSGEKISGVLKFFQYAPSGGWVYLARMFQFGDLLGPFLDILGILGVLDILGGFVTFWAFWDFWELPFLQIFLYASILICVAVISATTIYIQFF